MESPAASTMALIIKAWFVGEVNLLTLKQSLIKPYFCAMKILAFGIAKDIVGGSSFDIELAGEKNVDELRAKLNNRFPGLMRLASYFIAVNDEYASADFAISEKDEIAIIPPVSGG